MTDEEILIRLAEIEGHTVTGEYYGGSLLVEPKEIYTRVDEGQYSVNVFNPIDFDAQCLALVKKYDADISSDKRYANAMWTVVVYSNEAKSRSLNRAVCLAIIEAHT